jgi:hypothetical protein
VTIIWDVADVPVRVREEFGDSRERERFPQKPELPEITRSPEPRSQDMGLKVSDSSALNKF